MHPAAEAPQAAAHSFLSALLRSEDCTGKHPIPKLPLNTLLLFILSMGLLALEICPHLGMAKNLLTNLKNWHETSMGMVMVG